MEEQDGGIHRRKFNERLLMSKYTPFINRQVGFEATAFDILWYLLAAKSRLPFTTNMYHLDRDRRLILKRKPCLENVSLT